MLPSSVQGCIYKVNCGAREGALGRSVSRKARSLYAVYSIQKKGLLNMQITIGSKVTLHFALRLADGTVADSSFDNEPVSFVVGDGALDKGLELALIGLGAGDRQTLTLMPGQAFGEREDAALQWVARDQFPPDMALQEGQIIGFTGQTGEDVAGAVIEIQQQRVRMDFNHPLAGREIEFEVEILSVENPI